MTPFGYITPGSASDAVQALAGAPGNPRFLAGGTTLVDLMKLNIEQPDHLIDITAVAELASCHISGTDELVFGALARMSDVADDPLLRDHYPVLAESLWRAASQQLRNMATLGGNLLQRTRCAYFRDPQYPCNKREPGSGCAAIDGVNRGHALLGGSEQCIAVYPGDWAIALVAMDAVVDTLSPRGTRTIRVEDIHREPGDTPHMETNLAPDELILRTRIPATRLGKASTYLKVRDRESYAFALISAAVALEMQGDTVREARIAIGGVATRPWRARPAEQSLVGQKLTDATAQRAGELALLGARTRPQNAFRVPLGVNTVIEALMIARDRG
jgi:xanthine dehydrogenase YagS FAD-binding subunit